MPSPSHLIEEQPTVSADADFIRIAFGTGRTHLWRPADFQTFIDNCQRALDTWFIEASRHRAVRLPVKHLRRDPASLLDKGNVGVKRRRRDPSA